MVEITQQIYFTPVTLPQLANDRTDPPLVTSPVAAPWGVALILANKDPECPSTSLKVLDNRESR